MPEIDVLLAVAQFLRGRGTDIYQVSIAVGKGIDKKVDLERFRIESTSAGVASSAISFQQNGPDICAASPAEWWQIECKGAGGGKPQTQRNSFDRALASTVSYYRHRPGGLPNRLAHCERARPFLGLAIPATNPYLHELRKRVQKPLRERLNLWILLYESSARSIQVVDPLCDVS